MTQLINYYYNFDVMFRVDLIDSVSLTDSVYLINFGVDIISDYPRILAFFLSCLQLLPTCPAEPVSITESSEVEIA